MTFLIFWKAYQFPLLYQKNFKFKKFSSEWLFKVSETLYLGSLLYDYFPGSMEAGVQGVPTHAQYLPPYLVKTKLWPEKFGFMY